MKRPKWNRERTGRLSLKFQCSRHLVGKIVQKGWCYSELSPGWVSMVSKGAERLIKLKKKVGRVVQDAELGLFIKMGEKDGCENSEVCNTWKYLK